MSEFVAGPIRARVALTFEEYHKACQHVLSRYLRLLGYFAYFAIIVVAYGVMMPTPHYPLSARLQMSLPVLAFPFLVLVVMPAMTYFGARQRWAAASEIREPKSYLFDEAGVRVEGATSGGFTAWRIVTAAERVGEMAALMTGQQQIHLIPIRSFLSPAEYERFVLLVQAKVPSSKL